MIISKCPLRISLAGGSTDLQVYLDKYKKGAVVTFTSNLYTYITLKPSSTKYYRIIYSSIDNCLDPDEIKNDIAREVIKHFNLPPVEVIFTSDIPSTGSGLASSSSYLISMINAALAFKILTLTGGFTITSGIFGAYLSFTDRQQNRAIISLAGAIIQCMVAAAVVPLYGLWGAVASTSVGTFATFALLAHSSTRRSSLALSIKHFVSIFLIFVFAMLVVNIYYLQLSSITLKILSGLWFGIIFILLSIIFKYWQKADYTILSRMLAPGTRSSKIVSALEKYSP
jgi:hypothetical protein